jgi:hypothetical protein
MSFVCSVETLYTLPHTLSKASTLSMDTKRAFLQWEV